ncbi:MAG: hypothetical protein UT05_C0007G0011 [Parcubacteria group bacterium GW2011_GWF2_38_76]|nr:MAG: hypothetical protein UT05_C0007G0011 [Parcubacteria group bacterium GW2011_GWF2_38_76]HBM46114.1 hypothetical protein [Patescibacteria group bacterium]
MKNRNTLDRKIYYHNKYLQEENERSITKEQLRKLTELIYRNVDDQEDREQSLCYIEGLSYVEAEEYISSFEI